mmetsp:Transcript_15057/g.22697  ORF Transcript_15057/g.22697 Transcript_15057/m.22697 type:complete len:193 (+) Transcript_15057:379-957(+)
MPLIAQGYVTASPRATNVRTPPPHIMAINNSILSILGFILSAYSVYVEHKVEQNLHDDNINPDEEFRALCDIDAIGASCSAVFQLPEGKMLSFFGLVPKDSALDIPNGILGMLFYTYVFIRCNMRSSDLILLDRRVNAVVCSLALASSVFLARKLYIIKEICVVCVTTHVLNTTVFCRAILEVVKKQKDKVT